jgi:hypothetical protein
VKQTLSVPAPRKRVVAGPRSSAPGTIYYRATTPATPGAPPRKLSGRLRAAQAMEFNSSLNVARIGSNVIYGRRLELEGHSYLQYTMVRYSDQVARVIGSSFGWGGTTND